MTQERHISVTILAILAGIGAFIASIHTLHMLHLFPIPGPFGIYAFFTFDFLGAILWGLLAAIYIWLMRMLWSVDPSAWAFLVLLSGLNLFLAMSSVLGRSSFEAMLPSMIINSLILIYCLLPGTREAFGTE